MTCWRWSSTAGTMVVSLTALRETVCWWSVAFGDGRLRIDRERELALLLCYAMYGVGSV